MFYITTLTIAGSDCSGGAGIQADIKTMSALGVYAASVITSVTAQNTVGVQSVFTISPDIVAAQIDSVTSDLNIRFAKIGMVNDLGTLNAIIDALYSHPIPYLIVDPVMVSSSGMRLMQQDALSLFCKCLLPMTYLLTPNIPEAEVLADMSISSTEDIRKAAHKILRMGCKAVLIKGGHIEGLSKADYLYMKTADDNINEQHVYSSKTVRSINTHGTGCTVSSAITAYLARGHELMEAVQLAKKYIYWALVEGSDVQIGHGNGPLNHFFAPEKLIKYDE